ncbi:MAG: helix-turn-helix domain-containing protein [Defluviitaleaceae bacterium]|nr:helix-turn-helix domain-containing protein [Defluviitaleaceae bacterium]
MDYHMRGQTIKLLSKQQGISITQLADGVMSRSNLSKFINGAQSISKKHFDTILCKLGHGAKRFFPYPITMDDLKIFELRYEINNAIAIEDEETFKQLLTKAEALPAFHTGIHRQTLLRYRAFHLLMAEGNVTAVRELLDKAIKITLPNFNPKLVHTYLLCYDDIKIISLMAQLHFDNGEHDIAIMLLEKLAKSIRDKYVDTHEKARALTFVLYCLSTFLGSQGRYEEAFALCDEAIDAGASERAYSYLSALALNKACFSWKLGRPQNEVRDLFNQAYFGHRIEGKLSTAEEIKEIAQGVLGTKFPSL